LDQLSLEFNLNHNSLVQTYFGTGNTTLTTSRKDVFGTYIEGEVGGRWHFSKQFSALVANIFYSRQEDVIKNGVRYLPDENYSGYRLSFEWDARNQKWNSTQGIYAVLDLERYPKYLNSTNPKDDYFKWQLDARSYLSLGSSPRLRSVSGAEPSRGELSFRGLLGAIDNNPSYPLQFYLGGAHLLRGDLNQRYTGNTIMALQSELVIPMTQPFSVAVFGELGKVGNDFSVNEVFHFTKGIGLRIDLNTIRTARIRIDWASSVDTGTFYFTFNQAFLILADPRFA
jgi:hemolysin activation/secretion protein